MMGRATLQRTSDPGRGEATPDANYTVFDFDAFCQARYRSSQSKDGAGEPRGADVSFSNDFWSLELMWFQLCSRKKL